MARQRVDNFVIEISGPQSDLATESTANTKFQAVIAADFKSVKKALLEDEQMSARGNGALPPIAGVYFDNAKASIEMYAEGARAIADYSGSLSGVALSDFLASVAQQPTQACPRSKIFSLSGSTITEDYHNAHSGSAVQAGIVPIAFFPIARADGSELDMIAGTYVINSNNEFTYLYAPTTTLEEDGIMYANLQHQYVESFDGVNPCAYTIRALGNDQKQNKKVVGAVGTLSVGSVGPNELPKLSFAFQAASGSFNFADTRPTPSYQKPKVFAGSQLQIGIAGSDDALTSFCGRVEYSLGVESVAEQCPNIATGIQTWLRGKGSCEVKVTCPHDFVPYSIDTDLPTSWDEFLESGKTDCFQLKAVYGQMKLGSIFGTYFPELQLVSVEEGDENNYGICTLTFRPKMDSNYPAYVDCLA
jgi:hypothetical protein